MAQNKKTTNQTKTGGYVSNSKSNQSKINQLKRIKVGELKPIYFLSITLENVRCFGSPQTLSFTKSNGKPRQWTIILGDNGTGKTTLLQSLILMSPKKEIIDIVTVPHSSSFSSNSSKQQVKLFRGEKHKFSFPKWRVNDKEREEVYSFFKKIEYGRWLGLDAEIIKGLTLNDNRAGTKTKVDLTAVDFGNLGLYWENYKSVKDFTVFGYGASRRFGEVSFSETSPDPTLSLFVENTPLQNPEEWLLQNDYVASKKSSIQQRAVEKLKKVEEVLIKILPGVKNIQFSQPSEKAPNPIVEFETNDGWVTLKDLSLGYRSLITWVVDFASRMFDRYPESKNPLAEPAVVLIDEIDLHLHPKWQRELIDYLTNLFPNTQFIVTTHSPLIVQAAAARDANIVVCRREGDHVVIDQSVEAVKNWRADQILTSDLFDLPTARPKEIEPFLEERQGILSKAKLTKKDEKRLQELEREIGNLPVSENPEDDKAMDIIRRAAERLQSK